MTLTFPLCSNRGSNEISDYKASKRLLNKVEERRGVVIFVFVWVLVKSRAHLLRRAVKLPAFSNDKTHRFYILQISVWILYNPRTLYCF